MPRPGLDGIGVRGVHPQGMDHSCGVVTLHPFVAGSATDPQIAFGMHHPRGCDPRPTLPPDRAIAQYVRAEKNLGAVAPRYRNTCDAQWFNMNSFVLSNAQKMSS